MGVLKNEEQTRTRGRWALGWKISIRQRLKKKWRQGNWSYFWLLDGADPLFLFVRCVVLSQDADLLTANIKLKWTAFHLSYSPVTKTESRDYPGSSSMKYCCFSGVKQSSSYRHIKTMLFTVLAVTFKVVVACLFAFTQINEIILAPQYVSMTSSMRQKTIHHRIPSVTIHTQYELVMQELVVPTPI